MTNVEFFGYFARTHGKKKFQTHFTFSLSGHLKQDKPGHVFGNVRLFQYPDKTLCVYSTLEHYIEGTQLLRKPSKLFMSYISLIMKSLVLR